MGKHLMSVGEIKERLGLSRQRVHQLTQRPDWPAPYDTLIIGKVWRRADIEDWIATQTGPRDDAAGLAGDVLYVVVCAGGPAREVTRFVADAMAAGWDVCVIATPSATRFLDVDALAAMTGHPVRHQYKNPDEPDVLPPPDAFVVAPATFNTINKLAAGISDTLALGLLNEGIGLGRPVVVGAAVNGGLAAHPGFQRNVAILRTFGVTVLHDPGGAFPWAALRDATARAVRPSDPPAPPPLGDATAAEIPPPTPSAPP